MSTATGHLTKPAYRPFALLFYFVGAYSGPGPWSRGGLDPFNILTVVVLAVAVGVVLVPDRRTLTIRPTEGK